jgi:hypothetical protein
MPGKNLKQTTQKSELVVEATLQKGGKKTTATKVEAAPVVQATQAPPVVQATQAPPQKGGKKATVTKVATPVVQATQATQATPVVQATVQKGGKKAPVAKVDAALVVQATVTKAVKKAPVAKTELKGGKKTATPKVETKLEEEDNDRHVRSFKVKLPNKEDFEGRFTGLTPYQAANKALSKYFRETEKPLTKITFSICESTRKSKKSTYTYVGQRQKLDVPVTYKIQDGREIVKNFKNSLKKVKKSELADSA